MGVQVAGRSLDALFRVEGVADLQRPRGRWNELHRPHRAGRRNPVGLPARFDLHDRAQQATRQVMRALGPGEQRGCHGDVRDRRAPGTVGRIGPQRRDLVSEVERGQREHRTAAHPGDGEVERHRSAAGPPPAPRATSGAASGAAAAGATPARGANPPDATTFAAGGESPRRSRFAQALQMSTPIHPISGPQSARWPPPACWGAKKV